MRPSAPAFAELVCATNFSFLRGASRAEELVLTSLLLGHSGLGIADRNTVAGVVRAWSALKELREGGALPPVKQRDGSGPGEYRYEHGMLDGDEAEMAILRQIAKKRAIRFQLATGVRLVFDDGTPDVVAHPGNRAGWGRLCRLLTEGNLRAPKGECHLRKEDLFRFCGDLLLVVMPERALSPVLCFLKELAQAAPGAVWLGATMPRRGDDRRRLMMLRDAARQAGVPLLATNDVLYADASARDLQDILTCIREGRRIEMAGRLLEANAERHLKHPAEMARLFADCPEAVAETQDFLSRLSFDLGELRYEYPDEPVPPGKMAQGWLEEMTWRYADMRYPDGIPAKVRGLLTAELGLIAKLGYARYFLTIHDIVRVAHDKGILCQGRGSAANSAVCYVLGITAVDPADHDLLFARFISEERNEPPDIDVDFEHERREEIIQHIYDRYGRERAGIAATVIHYRPKSAIRDVGKALGLSEDVTAAIAGTQWGSWGSEITKAQVRQAGVDPENRGIARAVALARRLIGFPRHLSQHVGGFVLARGRLDETVPIANAAMKERTFIEWDKDDIDALKMMKVDVLGLGMLTCIRKALDLLRDHDAVDWALADVPREDAPTYDMLCKGDSIGVFQVESRAQINMLPRLKPRKLYDLVVQVAIVRPGPIQGQMVHPYLKRRANIEPYELPSPNPPHDAHELHDILKNTYGVPLFQEQAMRIAMVAAEFTDVEANQLRRAMATFRNVGTIHRFERMMVDRMVARGYAPDFAQRCYQQIEGFGSYGFPESHAASFAQLVYISSFLKCHYPEMFACALLNAQPMGFYAPAQIVRDVIEHGIEVRPVDVNHSYWDNVLEAPATDQKPVLRHDCGVRIPYALRLGFRQADGIRQEEANRLVAARGQGFSSVEDVSVRAGLFGRPMHALADADTFRSLGLGRREALWAVRRLPRDEPLPLFAAAKVCELGVEPDALLPPMSLGEHVATDYQTMRLSLKAHPMQFLRSMFRQEKILSCAETASLRDGEWARTAGLVLVRQRPGKGNAIFITLEDETGITNALLWARDFERLRRPLMASRLMLVVGRVQKSPEGIVHLMATNIIDRTADLKGLWGLRGEQPIGPFLSPADEASIADGAATSVYGPTMADLLRTRIRNGDALAPDPTEPPIQRIIPPPLHLAPPPRHRHPRNARILPKSRDFH
jgi:error-prone DNA polymerase